MQKALGLVAAIGVVALVIIGLVNFDLFISIWAKALVAVVIVGVFVALVRAFFLTK